MWKAITLRRPLRRRADPVSPPEPAPARSDLRDNPFADLMAKLDRIPYQPRRRAAWTGR
jgi:hypothetical protein